MIYLSALAAVIPGTLEAPPVFNSAQAVWPEGRETEMNLFVGFRAVIDAPESGDATLRVAASTLYRCFVNGEFLAHGPARGPHGYYRVDEHELRGLLRPGKNIVAFEVAGYNSNSFYVLDQPSFFQAEIVSGDAVLAATGNDMRPMEAFILEERVQKVQRYSFQRPFVEVYRLNPESAAWRMEMESKRTTTICAVQEVKALLPRRVPYVPREMVHPATARLFEGALGTKEIKHPWRDRSLVGIGPKLKGYPLEELAIVVSDLLQPLTTTKKSAVSEALTSEQAIALKEKEFHTFDLGQNLSGFPRVQVHCAEAARLVVTFDECLTDDEVNWMRLGCVNAVVYDLAPGDYDLEAFEPYTMRYLNVMALSGSATIQGVGMRRYENPDTQRARFESPDPRLQKLFEAGISTYAQNAVDVYMDCPHRERAGWLCDSFFTARSEFALSGGSKVEENFVEALLLPDGFKHLPKGMLPMCYPSDHYDGVFIPNWALWFVVQLGEYLERTGDQERIDALKPRVTALFDYFAPLKNEDGLLEKLESWVFVEWSEANKFVQDVNYPSNMLFAGALSTAAKLYGEEAWAKEADQIRATILKQSFDGAFFVDNALRKEKGLEITKNKSEVCQYFAFFFDVATPKSHPALWGKLMDEFGPKRAEQGLYKKVHPANSFIGNMLRVELLSQAGHSQQILDESIDYLLYMAERNGTLWENDHAKASLNHGFASHIVHTLFRDVLGVYNVDPVKKHIEIHFAELELQECAGTVPVGEEEVRLKWRIEGDNLHFTLHPPKDFTVKIRNSTGKQLIDDGITLR
jgi:alpha-L-rhamnosidase